MSDEKNVVRERIMTHFDKELQKALALKKLVPQPIEKGNRRKFRPIQ